MFESLLQAMTFGKVIKQNDKEYSVLHSLPDGWYLVIESKDKRAKLPAPALLIKEEETDET